MAREVRIFVRGACELVDPAALLEFGKREPGGGDKMAFVQQFVAFAV